ncbi:histidine kinase [Xanthobacter sediminis]|uniref:histidine kinase n=1 Tax=Xanthobacter sediminis TaxID=3119926 RepID=UPI003726B022
MFHLRMGRAVSMAGAERVPASAISAPARQRVPTLRAQVLGIVLAINAAAALVAGWVIVLNARAAARSEMAASVEMAEQMVREAAERIAEDPRALDAALPSHLRHLRHVRLSVSDAGGRVISDAEEARAPAADERAPAWFARLVGVEEMVREVAVTVGGATVAHVTVAGVPDDEVAEVWNDMTDFAAVAVGVNAAILAALFVALGRVRRELGRFRAALGDLQQARFVRPLAPPRVRELAEAAEGVNALAAALDAARRENARLSARLVGLEEEERRRIAGELHDELGPLLFGLKAGSDSLARMAVQAPPALAPRLAERAGSLVDIVARMQEANRRLLRRLRPPALGCVPLADVLENLLADFRRHDPERAFRLEAAPLRTGYGAAVEATLYRCAQEGVTNALRHGEARTVRLALAERVDGEGRAWLRLDVQDDGVGLGAGPPRGASEGLGLAGMRERVRALGGWCALTAGQEGGARLKVEVPLDAPAAEGARP